MEKLEVDEDGVVGQLVNAPHLGVMYREALDWLRRPGFLSTVKYQQLQWIASRKGAYRPLVIWEASFVNKMHRLGVPVHCPRFVVTRAEYDNYRRVIGSSLEWQSSPHHLGYAVDLVHSVVRWDMPPICWQIFRHVGEELAEQQGLDIVWGGLDRPTHWEMALWREWRWAPEASEDHHLPVV